MSAHRRIGFMADESDEVFSEPIVGSVETLAAPHVGLTMQILGWVGEHAVLSVTLLVVLFLGVCGVLQVIIR